MTLLILTMAGAACGAPARWLVDRWIQARHDSVFPWGTFTINVIGSLLLGGLLAASAAGAESPAVLALAGAGFCGGFTTFSTFGYETVRLAQEGASLVAGANVLASVAASLAASVLGWLTIWTMVT